MSPSLPSPPPPPPHTHTLCLFSHSLSPSPPLPLSVTHPHTVTWNSTQCYSDNMKPVFTRNSQHSARYRPYIYHAARNLHEYIIGENEAFCGENFRGFGNVSCMGPTTCTLHKNSQKNFRRRRQYHEIRKSFHPRKFPAVRYILAGVSMYM